MRGVIKTLNASKGFGFIAEEKTSVEHFFHRSAVQGTPFHILKEGDKVEFETEDSAKGPRAGRVTRL